MPIHDWTRVDAGLFHDFHQSWSIEIKNALNAGILPKGYYALVEQRVGGPEPDVIAVETGRKGSKKRGPEGATALADPPRTRLMQTFDGDAVRYARKANRISVRHQLGTVVAVIEIVSPGNKGGRAALKSFVDKAVELLTSSVHLLIADLFPPTPRDPHGIHRVIWDEFDDEPFKLPAGQTLTFVGYDAGPPLKAYIETAAIGDRLPSMPLFIAPRLHVKVPLDETYMATWEVTPEPIRDLLVSTSSRRRR